MRTPQEIPPQILGGISGIISEGIHSRIPTTNSQETTGRSLGAIPEEISGGIRRTNSEGIPGVILGRTPEGFHCITHEGIPRG